MALAFQQIAQSVVMSASAAPLQTSRAHPMTDGPLGANVGFTYRTLGRLLYGDEVRAARAKAKVVK